MTTVYLGLDVGFSFSQPLTATGSPQGKTTELALVTDGLSRSDAVAAVERLKLHLSSCSWPPS